MKNASPLFDFYKKNKVKLIDWYGFSVPEFFSDPTHEHKTTREKAGISDTSFLGKIRVEGKEALEFLNIIITRDISKIKIGQLMLAVICYENGKILDDVTVFRLAENYFRLVTNPSNLKKVTNWLQAKKKDLGFPQIRIFDETFGIAKFDLQGPKALAILSKLIPKKIKNLDFYFFFEEKIFDIPCLISQSGYSGEWGCEIFLPWDKGQVLWEFFLEKGFVPIGYQARNTLRIEGGFSAWGVDIDGTITPLEARYAWLVNFEKEFIGKEKLLEQKISGVSKKLSGFFIEGRNPASRGDELFYKGKKVGVITSSVYSPTFQKVLALGYIPMFLRDEQLSFLINKKNKASYTTLPFYKRSRIL